MLKQLFIFPIKLYQWIISPWLPKTCRFEPSCSNYMIQAIQIHGIFRGIMLGSKRILRCNPWGGSGYDPVPHNHSCNH